MRRFRALFAVFALALLASTVFLVHRALRNVALERRMRHQVVAERLFDEMERQLSSFLDREQARPFEDYGRAMPGAPGFPFIVGRFQIEPDGSVRALPAPESNEGDELGGDRSEVRRLTREDLERTVGAQWGQAPRVADLRANSQQPGTTVSLAEAETFQAESGGQALEQEGSRKGKVSALDAIRSLNRAVEDRVGRQRVLPSYSDDLQAAPSVAEQGSQHVAGLAPEAEIAPDVSVMDPAPMTARLIDAGRLMLYRTIVHETRGYRQGALIEVGRLGDWLENQALGNAGLAEYTRLSFVPVSGRAARPTDRAAFFFQHRFAQPFGDLSTVLELRPLPGVGGFADVYLLSGLLLGTAVLGLAALYRMVSVVVRFAERRSNFVAAVSHELKTPLTAIRMYGEMLRDGTLVSEEKRGEYYRRITAESERLGRLIDNVLELSRLEKGNRHIALVQASPGPVIEEAAAMLRPHVEEQGFIFQVQIEEDLPPVGFERDALVQVVCNLVDNGVKYSAAAPDKRIDLDCRRDAHRLCITVRDHGPGVSSRHIGKIFEPFYRGENELTRRSKGTGIGLALVRGLAERMGARATGHNVPSGGFAVEIAWEI